MIHGIEIAIESAVIVLLVSGSTATTKPIPANPQKWNWSLPDTEYFLEDICCASQPHFKNLVI